MGKDRESLDSSLSSQRGRAQRNRIGLPIISLYEAFEEEPFSRSVAINRQKLEEIFGQIGSYDREAKNKASA